MWEAIALQKLLPFFSTKNISGFGYKVVKHLSSWPLNELAKLRMLWTTGPWLKNHLFYLLSSSNPAKTRAPHAGANARLQQLLENSKSKRGCNYVKKNFRITSPTGMGSPFDSKQLLWISSSVMTEILESVKVFARRCRHQGYDT